MMAEFSLVEPFDIDDGSLAGMTPELIFALGVEWEMFRRQLKNAQPFSTLALEQNSNRLVAMAERNRRFVEHHPNSEGWVTIIVGNQVV